MLKWADFAAFTVLADWEGMRVTLLFEAVMGHTEVYVNGRKAGEHFDGYLPFEIDITDFLVRSRDTAEIYDIDESRNKEEVENIVEVGVRRLHLFNKQSKKYKNMRTPYPHGSNTQGLGGIWQNVFLLATPKVYSVTITTRDYPQNSLLTWSPDSPNLYTAEWTLLTDNNITDHKSERFG